ncbi:MAG: Minf_1886 family protein [Verrucomicrobiota bacterium]
MASQQQTQKFTEDVRLICLEDPRYSLDSYLFVREGLDHTLKLMKRNGHGASGHVSGIELLNGIRDYSLKEFGPMTKSVLNEWGVKSCEDFGHIVFNLVNKGVLGKTQSDSIEDFKKGFNFDEAFVKPFQPQKKTGRSSSKAVSSSKTRRKPTTKSKSGSS